MEGKGEKLRPRFRPCLYSEWVWVPLNNRPSAPHPPFAPPPPLPEKDPHIPHKHIPIQRCTVSIPIHLYPQPYIYINIYSTYTTLYRNAYNGLPCVVYCMWDIVTLAKFRNVYNGSEFSRHKVKGSQIFVYIYYIYIIYKQILYIYYIGNVKA